MIRGVMGKFPDSDGLIPNRTLKNKPTIAFSGLLDTVVFSRIEKGG